MNAHGESVEGLLASLSLFEGLRADEVGRIAARFAVDELRAGEQRTYGLDVASIRLVVVVAGRLDLEAQTVGRPLRARLEAGDRYGDLALQTNHPRQVTLTADEDAVLATIDRAGLESIIDDYPAVALPLADGLARELSLKLDHVRQLMEVHAEGFSPAQLEAAIAERRDALTRRAARVSRLSPAALFRRLVVRRGAEPPFWMLIGFIVALGGARLVVATILKYGLEKQLFALVHTGNDPNPMHVHHFNYGLILIGSAGLSALFPFGRRILRVLSLLFGIGCGLVFDEFALFWNLNPEYAQGLSLLASWVSVAVLLLLSYFRAFWAALLRRSFRALRGTR